MRKLSLAIILMITILSCSKHDETPVTPVDDSPKDSPAVKLYFCEDNYNTLSYMYTDTLEKSFIIANPESGLTGTPACIAYNHAGKRLYIVESDNNRVLRTASETDNSIKLVYDSDNGILNPTSIAIDTVAKVIYWANGKRILTGDLFGNALVPHALYDSVMVDSLCYGLAIDHKNNKLYIADNLAHQILVGNLDGTGKPTVLYKGTADQPMCPRGIVLSNKMLYWADECNNVIASASADGKGPINILFDAENDAVSLPNGIAVDYAGKKIYWSDYDTADISRGNLDGSGTSETVLSGVYANSITLQLR